MNALKLMLLLLNNDSQPFYAQLADCDNTIRYVYDPEEEAYDNLNNTLIASTYILQYAQIPEDLTIDLRDFREESLWDKNKIEIGDGILKAFIQAICNPNLARGLSLKFGFLHFSESYTITMGIAEALNHGNVSEYFSLFFYAFPLPVNLCYEGGLALIKALRSEHCPRGIHLAMMSTRLVVSHAHALSDEHQDISYYQENFHAELLNTFKDPHCKPGITFGLPPFLRWQSYAKLGVAMQLPVNLTLCLHLGVLEPIEEKSFMQCLSTTLKTGAAPSDLSLKFIAEPDGPLYITMLADALASGHCPVGLTLSFRYSWDRFDHFYPFIAALAKALMSGKAPSGLHLEFTFWPDQEIDMQMLLAALLSGKCPDGLHITLNACSETQAKALCAILKSQQCPQGLKLSIVSSNKASSRNTVPPLLEQAEKLLQENEDRHLALQYTTLMQSQHKPHQTSPIGKLPNEVLGMLTAFNYRSANEETTAENINPKTYQLLERISQKMTFFTRPTSTAENRQADLEQINSQRNTSSFIL